MASASLTVPHYEQEFVYSCVPACVRMVLAFHGQLHSEADLRQLLNTTPHGTPARNVLTVATLGFDVQLGTGTTEQLRDALAAGLPPIVFLESGLLDYWQSNCFHVAVVVGIDDATVSLNDPLFSTAPQKTSLAGFQRAWAVNEQLTALLAPRP